MGKDEETKYSVEAEHGYSTHTGMVFGQYVSDADRKRKVLGYRVVLNGRPVTPLFRTRREAQVYADRRNGG